MIELVSLAQGIIERGFIFGITVAGVYVASRLIKFDNLAIEGAFGLGGAVTALLLNWGVHPWISLIIASIAGALSGVVTGLLTTKLKLNNLMSGIVVTTGLFSIMLKLAGSNMALADKSTIFTVMPQIGGDYQRLMVLLMFCAVIFCCINWLLKTEIGFLLHAVGDAPQMLINIGKNPNNYLIGGLALSNALAATSGALFVQYAGYFSIWTNVGILIVGLVSMMLAQAISTRFGFALLFGAIMYQAIIALTFELQLDQDWNKLVTALLMVVLVIVKQWLHNNEDRHAAT